MRQCCPQEAREKLDGWIDRQFPQDWQAAIMSTSPGFLIELNRNHNCEYALRSDRADAVA